MIVSRFGGAGAIASGLGGLEAPRITAPLVCVQPAIARLSAPKANNRFMIRVSLHPWRRRTASSSVRRRDGHSAAIDGRPGRRVGRESVSSSRSVRQSDVRKPDAADRKPRPFERPKPAARTRRAADLTQVANSHKPNSRDSARMFASERNQEVSGRRPGSPSPHRGKRSGARGNAVKHSSYRKPNTPPCRSRLRPAIRIGGQSPLLQNIGRFRRQLQVRPRQECLTPLGEGAAPHPTLFHRFPLSNRSSTSMT